jgi:hypothetical protein
LQKLQVLVSDLDETAIHGAVALVDLKEVPAASAH